MTGFIRNVVVNTIEEALEEIRDLLVSELWQVETGTPASLPLVLKGKEDGGIRPWIRYSNPSGTTLTLQGDFDGTGSNLSTARNWVLGAASRIWMAADDEATCQYIKPTSGNGDAYHAGRLDRANPLDTTAIQVGILTSSNTGGVAQNAQQLNSSAFWNVNSTNVGIHANIFTGAVSSSTTLLCPATGTPILGSYFRFSTLDGYRGDVKFAVSGLAGAAAGTEFEIINPNTLVVEKAYICSGFGGFLVYEA